MNNTDMVSVPRGEIELTIHCLRMAGEDSSADELQQHLDRPAEHQGEPVALPARKGAHLRYDTLMPTFSKGWNACLDEIAKLGPLYTHADPGEVERLYAENIRLIEDRARFPDRPDDIGIMIGCHIGNLKNQAKSSEGYARKWRWELEAAERKLSELEALCWGLIGSSGKKRAQYLEKLQAALSASAEPRDALCEDCNDTGWHEPVKPPFDGAPVRCTTHGCPSAEPSAPKCKACGDTGVIDDQRKDELPGGHFVERGLVACKQCEEQSAPVELDEQAEFEAAHVEIFGEIPLIDQCSRTFTLAHWFHWELWQARAALERRT